MQHSHATRRFALGSIASAVVLGAGLLGGTSALAQAYPTKPVTIIVPFAAGGTIAEAGVPGYEATSWFGMFAPAGTPALVLAKLNAAIVKVLAQPDVKKKINEQGAEVYSETPEQFAAFIQAESVKWGKVVKESGASLD
jgi:tripartite-type tricarboxylate transporter receptor subunit TctC